MGFWYFPWPLLSSSLPDSTGVWAFPLATHYAVTLRVFSCMSLAWDNKGRSIFYVPYIYWDKLLSVSVLPFSQEKFGYTIRHRLLSFLAILFRVALPTISACVLVPHPQRLCTFPHRSGPSYILRGHLGDFSSLIFWHKCHGSLTSMIIICNQSKTRAFPSPHLNPCGSKSWYLYGWRHV